MIVEIWYKNWEFLTSLVIFRCFVSQFSWHFPPLVITNYAIFLVTLYVFFPPFLADKMNNSSTSCKHLKIRKAKIPANICESVSFSPISAFSSACLEDCRNFLQHHGLLLSSWPSLFIQQALNEPPNTSAHTWAQGLVKKGGVHVVKWLNNDRQDFKHIR